MTEMSDFTRVEFALKQTFSEEAPSAAFVGSLRGQLAAKSEGRTALKQPAPRLKLAWALVMVLAALAVAVLAIGPGTVLAQIERWFRFIPDYGFVGASEPLVIAQPVYQDTDRGRITLTAGFADQEGTHLSLGFDHEPVAPDGPWLENPDGRELPLQAWAFVLDREGKAGLDLRFEPLLNDGDQWTLRSNDGWNLPFKWQPASASDLPQPNLIISPTAPTPAGGEAPSHCLVKAQVRLCLVAVSVSGGEVSLLLESPAAESGWISAPLLEPFHSPRQPENLPRLRDASGREALLALKEGRQREGSYFYTLTGALPEGFEPHAALGLALPAVRYIVPVQELLRVDLGPNPQEGQKYTLDQSILFDNMALTFGEAEVIGSRLYIYSDPFQPDEGLALTGIELSKPARVDDMYGAGFDGKRVRVMVALDQHSGPLSGELEVPVIGVCLAWLNPPVLQFQIADVPESAPTPPPLAADPVLEAETYPETLDLVWNANEMNTGDLLYADAQAETTEILRAKRQAGAYVFEPLAAIPGHVASLKATETGLAFILGRDDGNPDPTQRRSSFNALYTAPAGSTTATLIADLPPYLVEAAWSPDGSSLALLSRVEHPQMGYTSTLLVIEVGSGTSRTFPLGPNYAYNLAWSSGGDQLAYLALLESETSSRMELFTLDLLQGAASAPRNLSAGQGSSLSGPIFWADGDSTLLTRCLEEALCASNTQDGALTELEPDLGWGLIRDQLIGGRWLVRWVFDQDANALLLKAYSLQTRQDDTLLTLPVGGSTKSQFGILDLSASPAQSLLAVHGAPDGPIVINLQAGESFKALLPEPVLRNWRLGGLNWVD